MAIREQDILGACQRRGFNDLETIGMTYAELSMRILYSGVGGGRSMQKEGGRGTVGFLYAGGGQAF